MDNPNRHNEVAWKNGRIYLQHAIHVFLRSGGTIEDLKAVIADSIETEGKWGEYDVYVEIEPIGREEDKE